MVFATLFLFALLILLTVISLFVGGPEMAAGVFLMGLSMIPVLLVWIYVCIWIISNILPAKNTFAGVFKK